MQIQLNQSEIETAVREYVSNQGINVVGKQLTLKFSMTRGENGLIADLVIENIPEVTPAAVLAGRGVSRGPAAKNVTADKAVKEGTVGGSIAKQSEAKTPPFAADPEPATQAEQAAPEAQADEAPVAAEEVKPSSTVGSLFG